MSYQAGEQLIYEHILTHVDYTPQNVSRADWKILNTGKYNYYCVIRMGAATAVVTSLGGLGGTSRRKVWTWATELLLYQRYTQDGTSAVLLQKQLNTLLQHLEGSADYSDTTGGIIMAEVTGISPMEQIGRPTPSWLRSTLTLTWDEMRKHAQT